MSFALIAASLHGAAFYNPFELLEGLGEVEFNVFLKTEKVTWKRKGPKKPRTVYEPTPAMTELHRRFTEVVRRSLVQMGKSAKNLRWLQSSMGGVKRRNTQINATAHTGVTSQWFKVYDFRKAYERIDLSKLSLLLTYICNHRVFRDADLPLYRLQGDEELQRVMRLTLGYKQMEAFIFTYFGVRGAERTGRGIATGANASTYLLNLYCEFWLDESLRAFCLRCDRAVYTRYVDDLVISSSRPLTKSATAELRKLIVRAGFEVHDRKAKNLSIGVGQVTITGKMIARSADGRHVFVYTKLKRRRLEGILKSYLPDKYGTFHMDWPKKCVGVMAEFLEYLRARYGTRKGGGLSPEDGWSSSDRRTFDLCRRFEQEYARSEGLRKRIRDS